MSRKNMRKLRLFKFGTHGLLILFIFLSFSVFILFSSFQGGVPSAAAFSVTGWGSVSEGVLDIPSGSGFIVISAGAHHNLALRSDGSIEGWGDNTYGQLDIPVGSDFIAVAAGAYHSLAIRSDGSIVGWGNNDSGQISCPQDNNFIAIAAGGHHSVALRSDGTVVTWGDNYYGQLNLVIGDYIAVDAGNFHTIALRSDGRIIACGDNWDGQTNVPSGDDFIAIASGEYHNIAIRSDGSLCGWGGNSSGESNAPHGNDYVSIAAGGYHSLALRSDGSITGWGENISGQTDVPPANNFTAVAAGFAHSLALRSDDLDNDGYSSGDGDCDDNDKNTYPGASEQCDGKDNDCDGSIPADEEDADADGVMGCSGDCNDTNAAVNPGAIEIPYDNVDQDCDGADLTDLDNDGYDSVAVEGGTDCNDAVAYINPGATETPYDGIDQDCDGADLTDVDNDGYDSVAVEGGTDCDDTVAEINPGITEVCDGKDNNCDGRIDGGDIDDDGNSDLCDPCPADPLNECEQSGSTAMEVLSEQGGVVQTPDKAVTIEIGPGALADDTTISVTKKIYHDHIDLAIDGKKGICEVVAAYDLEPDGLTFITPVTLTIVADISNLNANQRNLLNLSIYTDTDNDGSDDTFVKIDEVSFSIDENPQGTFIATFEAEIYQFSIYAVLAPVDTDNDSIPDLFLDAQDHCPSLSDTEAIDMVYTGDFLVPSNEETGSAVVSLAVELSNTTGEQLVGLPVNFSVIDKIGNLYGGCEVSTDDSGIALCNIDIGPDVYTLIAESIGFGCPAASIETVLVVFDPSIPRATGGGFILPDVYSTLPAEDSKDKANFGFIIRVDKNQEAEGNLEFQYKTAGINLKSQNMIWYTVSNNKAIFQGEGSINNNGLYTFRVTATDGDLLGDKPDAFDIKIWMGTDTESDPYHHAKNELAGGSIVIHKK